MSAIPTDIGNLETQDVAKPESPPPPRRSLAEAGSIPKFQDKAASGNKPSASASAAQSKSGSQSGANSKHSSVTSSAAAHENPPKHQNAAKSTTQAAAVQKSSTELTQDELTKELGGKLTNIKISVFKKFLSKHGWQCESINGGHEKWTDASGKGKVTIPGHGDKIHVRTVLDVYEAMGLRK